jgi:hypothetical protein
MKNHPSQTAKNVALLRAAHQLLDGGATRISNMRFAPEWRAVRQMDGQK